MDLPPNSASPNPADVAGPPQRISDEQLAAAARLRDYWMQRHLASLRRAVSAADDRQEALPTASV